MDTLKRKGVKINFTLKKTGRLRIKTRSWAPYLGYKEPVVPVVSYHEYTVVRVYIVIDLRHSRS